MCRWGAPQLLTCHVTDRDDKAQPIAMVIAGISCGCVNPDQRIIHCGTVPIQHGGSTPIRCVFRLDIGSIVMVVGRGRAYRFGNATKRVVIDVGLCFQAITGYRNKLLRQK
nr:hypothetical protein [uncultured Desulfobulbus sp.]